MQNDKAIMENPYVCKCVLEQIGTPKNFYMCKAMNVYDKKFRVNIYTKSPVDGLTGEKISITKSHFCKLDGNNVTILN